LKGKDDIMEILSQYVVLVVVGICFAIGYVIKNSLSFIPNKYIPLIMAVLGVMLNVWLNKWTFTPEILLGGLASGLASTGAFELVRNIKGGGKDENK
jgi:hypothetical protein